MTATLIHSQSEIFEQAWLTLAPRNLDPISTTFRKNKGLTLLHHGNFLLIMKKEQISIAISFFSCPLHIHKCFCAALLTDILAEFKYLLSNKNCPCKTFLTYTTKCGFSTIVLNLWTPTTSSWGTGSLPSSRTTMVANVDIKVKILAAVHCSAAIHTQTRDQGSTVQTINLWDSSRQ